MNDLGKFLAPLARALILAALIFFAHQALDNSLRIERLESEAITLRNWDTHGRPAAETLRMFAGVDRQLDGIERRLDACRCGASGNNG